jgi:hypothetical protein
MVIPLLREDCLRVTHPCATLLRVAPFLVRLACVKRAANVRSEPGSNSPVKTVSIDPCGRNHQRISFGCQVRRPGETRPFAIGSSPIQFSKTDCGLEDRGRRTYRTARDCQGKIVFQSTQNTVEGDFSGVTLAASSRPWVAQSTHGCGGVKRVSLSYCIDRSVTSNSAEN